MTAHSQKSLSVDAALGISDLANEQRGLLDLIDKLQFAQLDNVKLPQIAVVGDQSAGKSSVLEAITGIPFQRDADACTRFATEIRLRRGNEEKFSIRIIPDKKSRTLSEQERLKRFGLNVDQSMSFNDLMDFAIDQIAPKNIPGRFVAQDVLVVEKTGPNLPLLTVVDLPGLVRVPNNRQSTDDIKAIDDLTNHYMKSSRTIILAVIAGNQDYVQAPVLTKARDFDPSGARTIGVLTKPDLTNTIGLEDKFLALVNNQDKYYHFTLGWYVVLNPGPSESLSAEDRIRKEDEFFATGKWGTLPPGMCGASQLKRKLSVQLQRHIGKHIRKLQKEIQRAHDDCMRDLKSLGDGKDSVEEMKAELVQLCSRSKELVSSAVHGTYINPSGKPFFRAGLDPTGTPLPKLRARAIEENKVFANRVRMHGEKHHFASSSASEDTTMKKPGISREDFARDHVKELLRQNTGTEFPLDHNPRLVYTLFQDNSENWSSLAQDHKNELGLICGEFVGEVIDHVWPARMREPLRIQFLDSQMKDIQEEAQKVLDALLDDLQSEIRPYDPEYESRVKLWREAQADRSYSEAEELLEKMLIYYELTAKTFITNVITQVVERHLLRGLLDIFDSVKIFTMENSKVEAIAAENLATREQRKALKAKKAAIEDARDLCNNLAMRKELKSYSKEDPEDEEDGSDKEESNPQSSSKKPRKPARPDRHSGGGSTNASAQSPSQPPPYSTSREEQRRQQTPVSAPVPVPQHAPPPVPPTQRPDKSRRSTEFQQFYPPTPPDTDGRPHFSAQEQQANGRPDVNGNQQYQSPFTTYDGTESELMYAEASRYGGNFPQSPTRHKVSRKQLFEASKA